MEMRESKLEAKAGSRPGQQVLRVSGPITVATLPLFRDVVRNFAMPTVILDLTDVPYIDSSAVGALVQTYVSCRNSGRRLALVGSTHRVKAVLKITCVDVLFTTFETLREAEEALA